MGNPPVAWPDVEQLLVAWLKEQTGRTVYTELPGTLAGALPCEKVERVGGTDGTETTKIFAVEIQSLADGANARGDALDNAGQVQAAMYRLSGHGHDGVAVDEVSETFAAAIEPYENDTVRRATATFGIAVRPHLTN